MDEQEECFYCGEPVSPAELEALGGQCQTCKDVATKKREEAARRAQGACWTRGPNSQRMI